ncbi:MAG: hypothetical protein NC904_08560 [Candidatus Omnitrophica bacterium]|nr:hypothetical protein [Candidatus Omnitrophota bacterium]
MSLTKALSEYEKIIEKIDFVDESESKNLEEQLEELKDYIASNLETSLWVIKENVFDDRIKYIKDKIKELESMVKALENKKKYFEQLTARAIKLTRNYVTYTDKYTERLYYVYPEVSIRNEVNKATVTELYGICGRTVIKLNPEEDKLFRETLPDLYDKLIDEDRISYDIKVTDIKESDIPDKEKYLITKIEDKVKFRVNKKEEA